MGNPAMIVDGSTGARHLRLFVGAVRSAGARLQSVESAARHAHRRRRRLGSGRRARHVRKRRTGERGLSGDAVGDARQRAHGRTGSDHRRHGRADPGGRSLDHLVDAVQRDHAQPHDRARRRGHRQPRPHRHAGLRAGHRHGGKRLPRDRLGLRRAALRSCADPDARTDADRANRRPDDRRLRVRSGRSHRPVDHHLVHLRRRHLRHRARRRDQPGRPAAQVLCADRRRRRPVHPRRRPAEAQRQRSRPRRVRDIGQADRGVRRRVDDGLAELSQLRHDRGLFVRQRPVDGDRDLDGPGGRHAGQRLRRPRGLAGRGAPVSGRHQARRHAGGGHHDAGEDLGRRLRKPRLVGRRRQPFRSRTSSSSTIRARKPATRCATGARPSPPRPACSSSSGSTTASARRSTTPRS